MNNQLSLFDIPSFRPPGATGIPLTSEKKKSPEPGKNRVKEIPGKPLPQVYAEVLADYIPGKSLEEICNTLAKHKVVVRITRKRYTKLGDYRSPHNGSGHRITVNHDLNKYAFLLTLVHELAHLSAWEKYRRKAKPHGKEWKAGFREMMQPFLGMKIFPDEIVLALNSYLQNPAASSCTDTRLLKTLRSFDKKNGQQAEVVHLEDIPEKAVFTLTGNTKKLKKGKKLRKRFLCMEVNSKRKYLVSPVAEVIVLNRPLI